MTALAALALLLALPGDVTAFVERFEGCVHWAGEEPYDADRAREIAQAAETLRCGELDRDEARLRRRYADRGDVQAALDRLKDVS